MNMHILHLINRKVSRWVVGVSLNILCAKGVGRVYIYIYIVYKIFISYIIIQFCIDTKWVEIFRGTGAIYSVSCY